VTGPSSESEPPSEGTPPEGGSAVRPRGRRERSAMLLRLDPAVHEALTRWAGDELRSTNAHVEWLLRKALADAGRLPR
jgi:hypothetical protein